MILPEASPTPPIYQVRHKLVMLDSDVAALFGTKTGRLNQATLARNADKFPESYAFQVTEQETEVLRSQNVTANIDPKRRTPPTVYTEEGVIMCATVLKTVRAVAVTKQVVRSFVALQRQLKDTQNHPMPDPVPDLPALQKQALPPALSDKVGGYIDRLANVTLNQAQRDAVMTEVRAFREEGFEALHAFAKRPSIKTATEAAELRKRLAEAERIEEEIRRMRAETRDAERLALIRDLLFMAEYERAREVGTLEEFVATLRRLDKPPC
ncbi:ORF6N domain-containing protein [Shimia sp. W99]